MGTLDTALRLGMKIGKRKYIPMDSNSIPDFILLLKRARKDVKIVTGEADAKFYEYPLVLKAFGQLLSAGASISLIFHKNDDYQTSVRELREDNVGLCNLKKEAPDQVHLYWAPRRPEGHYAVIDSEHFLLEGDHESHGARDVWIEYSNPDEAHDWNERFSDFISKPSIREVALGEIN